LLCSPTSPADDARRIPYRSAAAQGSQSGLEPARRPIDGRAEVSGAEDASPERSQGRHCHPIGGEVQHRQTRANRTLQLEHSRTHRAIPQPAATNVSRLPRGLSPTTSRLAFILPNKFGSGRHYIVRTGRRHKTHRRGHPPGSCPHAISVRMPSLASPVLRTGQSHPPAVARADAPAWAVRHRAGVIAVFADDQIDRVAQPGQLNSTLLRRVARSPTRMSHPW
jgi:hypothetical protein